MNLPGWRVGVFRRGPDGAYVRSTIVPGFEVVQGLALGDLDGDRDRDLAGRRSGGFETPASRLMVPSAFRLWVVYGSGAGTGL